MFQLHVRDYQLSYTRCPKNQSQDMPFINPVIGSVCFVNVYLMPKAQLIDLVKKFTGSWLSYLPDKISYGNQIRLNCSHFYNTLTKLCQLEGLDVLCFNPDFGPGVNGPTSPIKEQQPSIPLLQDIYFTYLNQFTNYTEHFLLYYLFQSPLV